MALLVVLSTALQVISKEKVTRLMVHGGKIQAEMVVGKSIWKSLAGSVRYLEPHSAGKLLQGSSGCCSQAGLQW